MSRIIATGHYLPGKPMTNEQFISQTGIDSSDEWIQQRSGITQRYFAEEDQTVSDLATEAARKALDKLDDDVRQNIRRIIVATMSAHGQTPSIANQVQVKLGLTDSWCFDVSGACSGFVMAYNIAVALSRHESEGYSLVIGAEKMSDILDFSDRGSSFLFGDGAGAVVLKHEVLANENYDSGFYSQPDLNESLTVQANEDGRFLLQMKGRDVFNFVYKTSIPSLADFISKQGDFDYLICHQANRRFLDLIEKKTGLPEEKIPENISEVANISAGSVPILLSQMVDRGDIYLDGSQRVVLYGFGAGLTWGMVSTAL